MRVMSAVLLIAVSCVPVHAEAPGFLLGKRAGNNSGTIPTSWDTSKNVLWKTDVPGSGWSSPILWGSRVFITSAVSDDKLAAPRKGLYITDLQGKELPGEHRWEVHCLDAGSGKLLWTRVAFKGKMTSTIHIKNSLASETPVTDGKHVWAYFGNVGVACFDFEGKRVWAEKTPVHRTRMGWGTAASPVLHGGKLYIVHDNEEKSFLAARDAQTGKELWRVPRKEGSNWATPFVWTNSKRTELVTAGTERVRSYGLDGKLLWEMKGMSMISIPTPFAVGDLLYVSSGYVADPIRRPVFAIRPGGAGDISLETGKTSNDHVVWCQWYAGAYHPTPVVDGEYLYVLHDRGLLACYEAKTGKEVYPKTRLSGRTSGFTASPWAHDGKVFCLSEDGETVVVQGGKEFKVVGRNKLDEMCLATPVMANGSLFVRTQGKLYCLRQR